MRTRLASGILTLLTVASPIVSAGKPNIIFILTDDLGYGDVGILFQQQREGIQVQTPELDAMAADLFPDFFPLLFFPIFEIIL